MSQYNHVSDSYTKKPLSQRYQLVQQGVVAQRDIYSAWLALHVNGDKHNPSELKKAWAGAEALLRSKGLCIDEVVNQKSYGFCSVPLPIERLLDESALELCATLDDVALAARAKESTTQEVRRITGFQP